MAAVAVHASTALFSPATDQHRDHRVIPHLTRGRGRIIAEDLCETSWDGQSFGKVKALADLPLGTTESITMDPTDGTQE
jgi:hypothetical protein